MKINNIEFTVESIGQSESSLILIFPHSEFTKFFSGIQLDRPLTIEGYEQYKNINQVTINPLETFMVDVAVDEDAANVIKILTGKQSVVVSEAKELRGEIEAVSKFIPDIPEAEDYTWMFPLWKSSTYYFQGDRVKYSDLLYKCKVHHFSSINQSPDVATQYWERTLPEKEIDPIIYTYDDATAIEHKSEYPVYMINTQYKSGDRVLFEGKLYKCDGDYYSNQWTTNGGPWYCLDELEEWDSTRGYESGDAVMYNNYCYVDRWGCTNDNGDPNTFPPTDSRYWEKL